MVISPCGVDSHCDLSVLIAHMIIIIKGPSPKYYCYHHEQVREPKMLKDPATDGPGCVRRNLCDVRGELDQTAFEYVMREQVRRRRVDKLRALEEAQCSVRTKGSVDPTYGSSGARSRIRTHQGFTGAPSPCFCVCSSSSTCSGTCSTPTNTV